MGIGALSLLFLFLLPIWRITLRAPQYPDGVTLYISINKITGDTPGALQNINILNHYVGMQLIEEDSIPELKYFPFIVLALVVLGLVVAFLGRRILYLIWGAALMILGGLGIYDFYLWEYDYGHNLNPLAPIKVPGMVYQPPLFGRKMLLNFIADSYPHWGSFFLLLAFAAALFAFYYTKRKKVSL